MRCRRADHERGRGDVVDDWHLGSHGHGDGGEVVIEKVMPSLDPNVYFYGTVSLFDEFKLSPARLFVTFTYV